MSFGKIRISNLIKQLADNVSSADVAGSAGYQMMLMMHRELQYRGLNHQLCDRIVGNMKLSASAAVFDDHQHEIFELIKAMARMICMIRAQLERDLGASADEILIRMSSQFSIELEL